MMSSNLVSLKAAGSDRLPLKRNAKRLLARHLQRVNHRVIRLAANKGKHAERIHELRTELRRSEAALKLFADFVPQGLTKRIRQQLALLRTLAGSVRDRDVLDLGLNEFDQNLPLEFMHGLKKRLHLTRERKLKNLIRYCRRITEQGLDGQCGELVDAVHWPTEDHNQIRKQFLCDALDRIANPFLRSLQELEQDERKFHQVRICGRHLRYTIDLLHDDLPETVAARIGSLLSELQSVLGHAHDRAALLKFIQHRSGKYPSVDASLKKLLKSFQREHARSLRSCVQRSIELGDQIPKLLEELSNECLAATRLEESTAQSF